MIVSLKMCSEKEIEHGTVARLRVELQNSRVEGSLEPAVQRAPPSYPIVEQRRAAEEAEKKIKNLKRQRLV